MGPHKEKNNILSVKNSGDISNSEAYSTYKISLIIEWKNQALKSICYNNNMQGCNHSVLAVED